MNVGDYVRTKYGIAKIEEVKPDDKHKTIWLTVDRAQYHTFVIKTQDIIGEPKERLIELIEVGDYVNGCMVINKKDDTIQIIQLIIPFDLKEKDIKSIVTKEQFESMEYKVGE